MKIYITPPPTPSAISKALSENKDLILNHPKGTRQFQIIESQQENEDYLEISGSVYNEGKFIEDATLQLKLIFGLVMTCTYQPKYLQ